MMNRTYQSIFTLILLFGLGLFSSLYLPAWSQQATQSEIALELVQDGQRYYQAGKFDQAAEHWQQAADTYEQVGEEEGMTKSLINKAQALQELGLVPKACETLLEALGANHSDCSPENIDQAIETHSSNQDSLALFHAIGLRSLGDVLRRQGLLEQSQSSLELSLAVAEGSPQASATWLSLGNTKQELGNRTRDRWDYEEITAIIDQKSLDTALEIYQPAFKDYRQAATLESSPPLPPIQAQLNHFQLLLDLQQWWITQTNQRIASWSRQGEPQLIERAEDFLSALELNLSKDQTALSAQIESNLNNLPPSHRATFARINFAHSLMELDQTDNKVERLLKTARQQARTLQDQQSESYALGYLAQLYTKQGQLDQATNLTRQALMLAQEQNINGDAREMTYLWQSQLGQLLKQKGDPQAAIAAYAAAFNTLQSLRNDLNANDSVVQFDFLQEVKPVYLELADLLLKLDLNEEELNALILSNPSTAAEKSTVKMPKNRLALARRVMESLQLAELDNFFQDPCSQEADVAVEVDDIDPQAAVIYPFVLSDRLELIISLPGQPLRQAAISIGETEVNETLDQLYDTLENLTANNSARNILSTSNPNPLELKDNLEKTLPLLSKLYGWFIQPFKAELKTQQIKHLVFVLNGKLQRIPMAALYDGEQYLIEEYGISLVPSLQLIDPQQLEQEQIKVLAAGVSQQLEVDDQIFPALENVPQELAEIQEAFPASEKFLNEAFTPATIETELQGDFPVVHLATHGLFSSNPEKNFILTGDGNKIGLNELSQLLKAEATRELELLVLSACETATGDERAVLGLAGMAVRSGARTTLATLWPVEDDSAAQVMGQFYQELKQEKSKLDAFRTAQLELIESFKANPPFEELKSLPPHPYYWAPYVLVGNWQ
jgi:CHAT domain-containing protein